MGTHMFIRGSRYPSLMSYSKIVLEDIKLIKVELALEFMNFNFKKTIASAGKYNGKANSLTDKEKVCARLAQV